MTVIAVPYHLDERLEHLRPGFPVDLGVTADLPPGGRWERMAVLYEQVASAVARADVPTVLAGDCTTSLGVLAGLQRAGHDVGIVWLDAHADFHTAATTTSGYLGGLPLALATGRGVLTLPTALGLRPVADARVLLVDARDTDPGEHDLLASSSVGRTTVDELDPAVLPDGELLLHVDVDVCDPGAVPGLRYPVAGGPTADQVLAVVARVCATGRIAAVSIAATWRDEGSHHEEHARFLHDLLAATSGPSRIKGR